MNAKNGMSRLCTLFLLFVNIDGSVVLGSEDYPVNSVVKDIQLNF